MIKVILKIFVSVGLITWLLLNVDWDLVLVYVNEMSLWALIFAFIIYVIQFPISTWKWKLSLEIHELDYRFLFLQKVLCIGFFFNNFLPTSIGGDAYRVIKTMPDEGFKSRSVSAVLLERIIGLVALLFLGFVGGIINSLYESNPYIDAFLIISIVGGAIAIILIGLAKIGAFAKLLGRLKKIRKLDFAIHNLGHIRRNPNLIVKVTTISIIFQILAVIAIGVLFDAMAVNAGYEKYVVIAATVGLASILPLSINGIGVIEGAFVISATQLGLGYNEAIIVAFVLRILVLPLSLVCGLIYLFDVKGKGKGRGKGKGNTAI